MLITAAIATVLGVVWQSAQVFFLLFGGVLLAVILRSAGQALANGTGMGVRWAIAIVLILAIAALGGTGWFAAPSIAEQLPELRESLRAGLDTLRARGAATSIGGEVIERANDAGSSMVDVGEVASRVAGGFATVFGVAAGLLIVLAVGVFLALDPPTYVAGVLRLVPPRHRQRAASVLETLGETLRGWMLGQLLAMLFLFLATWLMLALMGVPLAFLLAVITGLMAFVPYVGPITAAVPILLVSFIESPALALQVGLLFLLIQTIEDNVILPLVFQKTIELPPALLIAGQLVLGGIFGILGVVFATPLTALAMVLTQELYVEDALGDEMQNDALPSDIPPNTPRARG